MSKENIIENEKSISQLIDNDIFYVRFHDNVHVDVKDIQESYDAYTTLSNGIPIHSIAELGIHTSVSQEARVFAQNNKMVAKSEALIQHSLSQRILVNFYSKFKNQTHPFQSFKSFDDAMIWINSLRDNT
jgi:hypothetical protein